MTTSSPTATATASIDELFRDYQRKLPEPATLSEGNGASFKCPHHGWVTYTLLYATAKKVPIASDNDLVGLVPWARNEDECLRHIAIEAVIARIKFDSNRVSLPGMDDPEHHHFHEIMVSLRAYLVAKKVAFDAKVFDGMMVDVTAKDFASLKGTWVEKATPSKNFLETVEIDGDVLRVTSRRTTPDPAWPDHTWTTKFKDVTVNERGQFVIAGEWDVESNAKGYKGSKIVPSQFKYAFWPVRSDIVWFDQGSGSWVKLRRGA